jgi:isopentenyl diphosphate isomerase/L-lactate dehydrogenase-like FMN-dependent dehydrogenase
VLELLRAEIALALQLIGCRTPAELTRAHVAPGTRTELAVPARTERAAKSVDEI